MDEKDRRRFILNVDIPRVLGLLGIQATFNTVSSKFIAPCPNARLGHDGEDHNPSWAIKDDIHSEENGVHGCWSCGYSGHVIGLVQDVLGLRDWKESIAWLQAHAMRGKAFAPLSVSVEVIEPKALSTLAVPEGVLPLHLAPYKCKSYWLLKRGFSMFDAFRWDVGGAATGVCFDRIWLPLYNDAGRLVNWTGRSIDDREPRYLRATSSLDPDKNAIFGERFWPDFPSDVVAISEGELNVIRIDSVFQIPVAAFGGGSKLNPVHAAKLMRFKRFIVFADGDKTGDKLTAALRDLGRPMAVLRFSDGHDPNSVAVSELIHYGKEVGLTPKRSEESHQTLGAAQSPDSPDHTPLTHGS